MLRLLIVIFFLSEISEVLSNSPFFLYSRSMIFLNLFLFISCCYLSFWRQILENFHIIFLIIRFYIFNFELIYSVKQPLDIVRQPSGVISITTTTTTTSSITQPLGHSHSLNDENAAPNPVHVELPAVVIFSFLMFYFFISVFLCILCLIRLKNICFRMLVLLYENFFPPFFSLINFIS